MGRELMSPVRIGAGGENEIQGLGAVLKQLHLIGQTMFLQGPEGQLRVMGIVFDEDYLHGIKVIQLTSPLCGKAK